MQQVIPKGRNYARWWQRIVSLWPRWKPKGVEISGYINHSWMVDFNDKKKQAKWQKVGGISAGKHHKFSRRLGVRYDPITKTFEFASYEYNNGVRSYPVIARFRKVGEQYRFVLLFNDKVKMPCFGYRLNAYFEYAPHDVVVNAKVRVL